MTEKPCPGGGKSWTVDKAGKPICPRCYRSLATVAGKGRKIKDLPKVPPHEKPSRAEEKMARRPN
jgi:uncharacterized Zn finger protein (UPF0148 family)